MTKFAARQARNLGECALPRRRRARDPMRDYDALPPDLRRWLAEAALPWSPVSAARIWHRARAKGADTAAILDRLSAAEARLLEREAANGDGLKRR